MSEDHAVLVRVNAAALLDKTGLQKASNRLDVDQLGIVRPLRGDCASILNGETAELVLVLERPTMSASGQSREFATFFASPVIDRSRPK